MSSDSSDDMSDFDGNPRARKALRNKFESGSPAVTRTTHQLRGLSNFGGLGMGSGSPAAVGTSAAQQNRGLGSSRGRGGAQKAPASGRIHTYTEQELSDIFDNKNKWIAYELNKQELHGAAEVHFQQELDKMQKEMRKMAKIGSLHSRGESSQVSVKPSLANLHGEWLLVSGGPKANLSEIIAEKFLSITREGQTAQEILTKTVKGLLQGMDTQNFTLTEGGKSRQGKYVPIEEKWVATFCDFVATFLGTVGGEKEVTMERCRKELKYQLEVMRRKK